MLAANKSSRLDPNIKNMMKTDQAPLASPTSATSTIEPTAPSDIPPQGKIMLVSPRNAKGILY